MTKYIISWDAGHGDNFKIIEAEDEEAATIIAYKHWDNDLYEDYGVEKYTKELAIDYGLEDE